MMLNLGRRRNTPTSHPLITFPTRSGDIVVVLEGSSVLFEGVRVASEIVIRQPYALSGAADLGGCAKKERCCSAIIIGIIGLKDEG